MLDFDARIEELSGIGDSFTNLIYSISVSNVLKRAVGKRASNYILSEAVIRSGLRAYAGSRLDRQGIANFAESLLFYAWFKKKITIEECVSILAKNLNADSLKETSINAFAELLRDVKSRD